MTAETVALSEIYQAASFAMCPIACHIVYLFHPGLDQQPDSQSPSC
jgi:hypothetical protein